MHSVRLDRVTRPFDSTVRVGRREAWEKEKADKRRRERERLARRASERGEEQPRKYQYGPDGARTAVLGGKRGESKVEEVAYDNIEELMDRAKRDRMKEGAETVSKLLGLDASDESVCQAPEDSDSVSIEGKFR